MLTSEQLRVIYIDYTNQSRAQLNLFFLTNMERVPQKRCGIIFLRNMERVPQTIIYSFREEKL